VIGGDANGEGVTVQAVNRRGRAIECRVSITPLHDGAGGNGGVILMMQDGSAPA
jgi:hypothetical protein